MTNHEKFLLCLAKAKKIVAAVKKQYPGSEDIFAAQNSSEMFLEQKMILEQFMPQIMEQLARSSLPTAQALLDNNKILAPQQAQLEADLFSRYGPGIAGISNQIAADQAKAASQTELDLANTTGADLVRKAVEFQGMVDPEAEATKRSVSAGLQQFLASQGGGKLNASELEQISRGLGRRGDANMPASGLKTLQAAQTFGDAGRKRWAEFGNALGLAASTIPSLRSGISGFEVATRRQVGQDPTARLSNPGFTSANQSNTENIGFANNILSNTAANQKAVAANQKSTLGKIGQGVGMVTDLFGMKNSQGGSLLGGLFG